MDELIEIPPHSPLVVGHQDAILRRRSREDVLVLKTLESGFLCGFEVDARLSPLRCRYDITPKVVVSEEADSHERFAASSSLARMSLA